MDLLNLITSTIDTCPHPSVKQLALLFDEVELRGATHTQFERFFRVWFTDTKQYAPHLTRLKVVLRASLRGNQVTTDGLQRFLEYFRNYVVHNVSDLKYEIFVDDYVSVSQIELHQIMQNPLRIRAN